MRSATYEAQLAWLKDAVETLNSHRHPPGQRDDQVAGQIKMLLSLAESVKQARDHDLNCPKNKNLQ